MRPVQAGRQRGRRADELAAVARRHLRAAGDERQVAQRPARRAPGPGAGKDRPGRGPAVGRLLARELLAVVRRQDLDRHAVGEARRAPGEAPRAAAGGEDGASGLARPGPLREGRRRVLVDPTGDRTDDDRPLDPGQAHHEAGAVERDVAEPLLEAHVALLPEGLDGEEAELRLGRVGLPVVGQLPEERGHALERLAGRRLGPLGLEPERRGEAHRARAAAGRVPPDLDLRPRGPRELRAGHELAGRGAELPLGERVLGPGQAREHQERHEQRAVHHATHPSLYRRGDEHGRRQWLTI